MKSIVRYLILVVCIGATTNQAAAQDLSTELSRVGIQNVSNYVNPIFNGFAADLNSAIYHSADLHNVLGFDVGVKFGFALITDAEKKYRFEAPASLNFSGGTLHADIDYDRYVDDAPTAVGAKDAKKGVKMLTTSTYYTAFHALHNDDVLFEIPNGFSLPAVPLPLPQAAIGLPFGLEVMIRFIPTVSAASAGKFNYMGFGLRYDVDQWIPMLPLDVSVHFMTQKMNFKSNDDKDIFKATGIAYGIEASKKLLFLTVYGGLQLEKATFTLSKIEGKFTIPDGTSTPFTVPETTFEGQNKFRATMGLRLLLAVLNVHAEYSFAKTPVAAVGIGISFR